MVLGRSNRHAAPRRVQLRSGIGAIRCTQFRLLCSFHRAGERSFKMFGGRLDVANWCYRHGLQSMIVILDFAQKFCHSVQSGRTLLCSLTWRHRVEFASENNGLNRVLIDVGPRIMISMDVKLEGMSLLQ